MIKKQSTSKGFALLGSASILNKVLSILYVPFLTVMIGDRGNGIANAGYVMYLLVFQITTMGIPVAISKMISEQIALGRYRESVLTLRVAGTMVVALGGILTAITALFSRQIAGLLGWPESAMTLFALAPTILLASVSSMFRGYFQGRHNMTPTSVSQILEQAGNTVFTLVFAWWFLRLGQHYAVTTRRLTDPDAIALYRLEWGAAGSGLGTTIGALFSASYLSVFYLRKRKEIAAEAHGEAHGEARDGVVYIRQRRANRVTKLTRGIARRVMGYSGPIILGVVIFYSANIVDMTFTKMRLLHAGFSTADAASLYGILTTQYNKLINVPLALANTLAVVILPGISGTAALKDQNALHLKITSSLRLTFLLSIPSAVILAVMAEPIIRLLFPYNVSGVLLMQLGSWVIILTAFAQLQTSVLQGMSRMHLPVINMTIALVVKIAVNFVLIGIHSINILGAVAGTALYYGLAGLLNYLQIQKCSGYRADWRKLLVAPLLASAGMGAAAGGTWAGLNVLLNLFLHSVAVRNLCATTIAVLIGGAVYALLIVACKGLSRQEVLGMPLVPKLVGRARLERLLKLLRAA